MERRTPTFPVSFVITKPTRFSPGGCQMYYKHEWDALQKSLQPAQPSDLPGDAIAGPAVIAESVAAATNPSESATSPDPSTSSISSTSSPLPPDFSRHARRCSVCSHPDRDAIEGDFIRWRSPELIARDYKIPDRSSIYRHAHSTGLFAWRRLELGRVLEGILEASEHLPLESADVIIRAARIYSHLDEHGNWFEPARINFILSGPAPAIYGPKDLEPPPPGRSRKRRSKKPNRNSRRFKKSVNSKSPKEKANS